MGLGGLIKNAARDPGHSVRARRNAQQLATAPKALNPTSGQIRVEVFPLESGKPSYGNLGRIIFVEDTASLQVDVGDGWIAT